MRSDSDVAVVVSPAVSPGMARRAGDGGNGGLDESSPYTAPRRVAVSPSPGSPRERLRRRRSEGVRERGAGGGEVAVRRFPRKTLPEKTA